MMAIDVEQCSNTFIDNKNAQWTGSTYLLIKVLFSTVERVFSLNPMV